MVLDFHNVQCRCITEGGEAPPDITPMFHEFLPLDFTEEKIKLEQSQFVDQFEEKRYILTLTLDKPRHVRIFAETLFSRFSTEQKKTLLDQLATRVDDEVNFYIRLDKYKLQCKKELLLTDGGNCFHIKFVVASYPKSKAVAIATVEKYINRKSENS
ncbi:MAG TPA: RNA-binding domain-containing protein [Acidobacteriota bacterium]|nr:RNA-binding domain-containing protein [Acidobacteriota bacterium]